MIERSAPRILLGFVCGVAATLLGVNALSAEDAPDSQDKEPATAGQPDEDMKETWRRYAFPGPEHEKLNFFEGEWDVATTMWMQGATDPVHSTATISTTSIFGGRFLQTKMRGTTTFESDGEMVEIPVEGIGYTGYDNFKKKFIGIWIDNHYTGIFYSEGLVDPTGKVFTYFGSTNDWQTGSHDNPMKYVDRIVDENTTTSEFYDLSGPVERKFMEMKATRRK